MIKFQTNLTPSNIKIYPFQILGLLYFVHWYLVLGIYLLFGNCNLLFY